jgi:hypothetical protein
MLTSTSSTFNVAVLVPFVLPTVGHRNKLQWLPEGFKPACISSNKKLTRINFKPRVFSF